ncbi:hypothetical protein [Rhizobium paknamense]|uniref:DUF2946 domain-containing protein n=1 Tax=Rhizobium paknamense TaxID=1206817 RepID=A0ABU0ICY6_9HYPH|nr:hypothetical protein [Rhizobium paknamense]MDQ0456102.1 hypothetical protein [Rhizobium paknamense]
MACALALLALGFAHRAPPAFADLALRLEFQLPDGSNPDICFGDHGLGQPGDSAALLSPCEACILAGSILLPAAPEDGASHPETATLSNPLRFAAGSLHALATPKPRSRGPPVSI